MKKNVKSADRVIRIVIGLVMIGFAVLYPSVAYANVGWLGVVPLVTGLIGWCGLYQLLGIGRRRLTK